MVVLDIPCCRCGKKVNQNEVRMDPEFKKWVCIDCSKKLNNKDEGTTIGGFDFSKNRKLRPIEETTNKKRKEIVNKEIKHMICMRCKFKFKRKVDAKTTKMCPNCGRDEIREYENVKNPAESLIKLSLDEKYNY